MIMDAEQRLTEFRAKVRTARSATELIDEIDKPLLTTAGWKVHADNRNFIGGTKIDKDGNEYELRVSRLMRSIAGTLSPRRRPAKPTIVDNFKVAMTNAFMERQIEVRKFVTEELPWAEIVKFI